MSKLNIPGGKLFCFAGESGAGKDSVVKELEKKGYGKSICSHTTRPMRDGEEDGREHWFDTPELFHFLQRTHPESVLAYTKIGEIEYMAMVEQLEESNFYVIDPHGILNLKSRFPDIPMIVIYITSSEETRRERASSRSDFSSAFNNRIIAEREQFKEFSLNKEYDYVVYNEEKSFEETLHEVVSILDKEQCR